MENNESDIFELSKNNYNLGRHIRIDEDVNPFSGMPAKQERMRHLNDYDFNILKDGAYKDISDDTFKLEYKIARTENEIREIESQIDSAKEIHDYDKINSLQLKLNSLKDDYRTLLAIYNDKTLSARITGSLSNILEKTTGSSLQNIKNYIGSIYENLLSKLPKRISSALRIKKSLYLLENINKSVDELVTMKIPYGENIDKYRQLSKYIIRANNIHSEIAGYLGKKV